MEFDYPDFKLRLLRHESSSGPGNCAAHELEFEISAGGECAKVVLDNCSMTVFRFKDRPYQIWTVDDPEHDVMGIHVRP